MLRKNEIYTISSNACLLVHYRISSDNANITITYIFYLGDIDKSCLNVLPKTKSNVKYIFENYVDQLCTI